MNIRWKKVLTLVAIASICFLALISVVDHLRVWAAGGVWCAESDPEGNVKLLYGAEACNIPTAAQSK
ncbi:hypothetical protein H6G00_13740 [Leptolyngbya sp. FACHB-541]|uniref:hypothetical protein n=1 Tax=Leptolyngbya sp. FACHB-541 TaxID=2692810 RepID=UPI0016837A86|nr:hypothetical protein [Leptolyngbya sp. FACHB-541]MBD1997677.1 hypothetical protein [Leptolyngbya sp. FACHB-541]